MAGELLFIIAAYGISIGLVHLLQWRCHWGRGETSHAVIVTRNAAMTVEWHLRLFAFAEWLQARHTKVTVLDEGSTDETLRIAEKIIADDRSDWEIVSVSSANETNDWMDRADHVILLREQGAGRS